MISPNELIINASEENRVIHSKRALISPLLMTDNTTTKFITER